MPTCGRVKPEILNLKTWDLCYFSIYLIKYILYYTDMDKFSALGDPNRRRIVELLANHGPLTATEISEKFSVSPSAISQHLKILREAGLIQMKKKAQKRIYAIDSAAVHEMENWAKRLTARWEQRFDALKRIIEAEKRKQA